MLIDWLHFGDMQMRVSVQLSFSYVSMGGETARDQMRSNLAGAAAVNWLRSCKTAITNAYPDETAAIVTAFWKPIERMNGQALIRSTSMGTNSLGKRWHDQLETAAKTGTATFLKHKARQVSTRSILPSDWINDWLVLLLSRYMHRVNNEHNLRVAFRQHKLRVATAA